MNKTVIIAPTYQMATYWLYYTEDGQRFIDECNCGRDPKRHIVTNAQHLRGYDDLTIIRVNVNRMYGSTDSRVKELFFMASDYFLMGYANIIDVTC